MTGCGALRAPRNLHATHTTMSVRGTRQPLFPACDACYELKQTELPGLPWSLARGDYAYYFQDAVPSRFLAWTGGGMDWLRSHQLLRYLTIRLTRGGGSWPIEPPWTPYRCLITTHFRQSTFYQFPASTPEGRVHWDRALGGERPPRRTLGPSNKRSSAEARSWRTLLMTNGSTKELDHYVRGNCQIRTEPKAQRSEMQVLPRDLRI